VTAIEAGAWPARHLRSGWVRSFTPVVAAVIVLPSAETLTPWTTVRVPAFLYVDRVVVLLRRFGITTSPSGLLPVIRTSFPSKLPV